MREVLLFLFEFEEVSHVEGEAGTDYHLPFHLDIVVMHLNGLSQFVLVLLQAFLLFVIAAFFSLSLPVSQTIYSSRNDIDCALFKGTYSSSPAALLFSSKVTDLLIL